MKVNANTRQNIPSSFAKICMNFYGHKNLLITQHKIWLSLHLVPASSRLPSSLVTITGGASGRGFWNKHSQSFEI